ncbi:MAG: hypothetical protein KGL42_01415 [Betaproteobacteria bacterium]|nr:hypothetical protein [Betaproteobacteria bacterium]
MHLKFRRGSALLYRSTWVPKASAGNTHGFSRQTYVGSMPTSAEAIPSALRERLSDDECAFIDARICAPAKAAAERLRMEEERRERDPGWRLVEAQRLVAEAAERSAAQPVTAVTAERLMDAVGRLRVTGNPQAAEPAMTSDPLAEALSAVRSATQAVANGRYGKAPPEQVRTTRTYKLWADLWAAVEGETEGSLLRALQDRGFVKRRGR